VTRFKKVKYPASVLEEFNRAAAGLAVGIVAANMLDRFIEQKSKKPVRLWLRIQRPRRPTPLAVIAAAFAARERWAFIHQNAWGESMWKLTERVRDAPSQLQAARTLINALGLPPKGQ